MSKGHSDWQRGRKLSDDHKKNIGNATKKMWESGVFDSDKIREKWRQTALSGIAKLGKPSPKRFIPTQEMLDDYSIMGNAKLSEKYGVSRRLVGAIRKEYSLPSFNLPHGTKPHEFRDGEEYKWCQSGHWELITGFGINRSRWDGLRGWCKSCEKEKNQEYYDKNDGAKKARDYAKTEGGRKVKSAIMRRAWLKRRGSYVKFELTDEEKIYNLCNQSCAYCKSPVGFDELEFDHFIPVKLGGMTEPTNMLPVCKKCNRGKGGKFDKDPHQWLIERFGEYYGESIYQDCVSVLQSLL